MADAVVLLQQLGFGEYEARAYVTLLQAQPLNGYELARRSGIPRANVYDVLQKLVARGVVSRLETPAGIRYVPVSPEELTRHLGSSFQAALAAARTALTAVAKPTDDYVWNARGYPVLLQDARRLIEEARQTILVALWPQEAAALAPSFERAACRGVAITTLCLAACPRACDGCQGRIFRYRVAPTRRSRWLVLVPDGAAVLAGEIDASEAALAVRTHQRLLVELASWYIRHSIALAAVLTDLGPQLERALRPETCAALAAIGPPGQPEGWLAHMRRLLDGAPSSEG